MAYNRGERPDSPMKRRGGRRRKKVCVFCGKENNEIDYKDYINKYKFTHILVNEDDPMYNKLKKDSCGYTLIKKFNKYNLYAKL